MNGSRSRPASSTTTTGLTQPVDERPHRPFPRSFVAVEGHRSTRQPGQRRNEAHHGSGESGGDDGTVQRCRFHPPIVVFVCYVDAECPERRDHELGITRPERAMDEGFAIGEAASTSARLVIDFDPGNTIRPRTGPTARGAFHGVGA